MPDHLPPRRLVNKRSPGLRVPSRPATPRASDMDAFLVFAALLPYAVPIATVVRTAEPRYAKLMGVGRVRASEQRRQEALAQLRVRRGLPPSPRPVVDPWRNLEHPDP